MKKNKEQTMNSNRRSKNCRNTTSSRKKGGDERSNKVVRSRRSTITKPNTSYTAKNNKKLREYSKRKSSETVSLSRSMSLGVDDQNIPDTGERRRSSRFTGEDLVETFALGDVSTRNDITDDTIEEFIQTYIKVDKPVVISLPVSPQRHAFLVYVKPKPSNKIMIADWYLREYKKKVGYQNGKAWKTYNRFMELLRESYPDYTMDFFPIDDKIKEAALIHDKNNNGTLGCSFYIYEWIEQHRVDLL